jgi:hypothetical protein
MSGRVPTAATVRELQDFTDPLKGDLPLGSISVNIDEC